MGGGLGVRGRGEAPTPHGLALEAGATQPALVDGLVRQAADGEALAGTRRLFRGGQRAWPRARRRGGRGLRATSPLSTPRPSLSGEQSLKPLSEAFRQLSALAWAGGRHSEVLGKGEALRDAVLSMV